MDLVRKTLTLVTLLLLLAMVATQPLWAQKKVIVKKGDPTEKAEEVIEIEIKDGKHRVTVNGETLSEEEAKKFMKEHHAEGDMHVFFSDDDRMKKRKVIRFNDKDMPFSGYSFYHCDDEEGEDCYRVKKRIHLDTANNYRDVMRKHKASMEGLMDDLRVQKERLFFDKEDLANMLEAEDFPFGVHLRNVREHEAEVVKMEMETHRLAMEIRRAEAKDREKLEKELEAKLEALFNRKQEARAKRVETLQKELEKLEADQKEREQARKEIIERRKKELLGQHDKFDW